MKIYCIVTQASCLYPYDNILSSTYIPNLKYLKHIKSKQYIYTLLYLFKKKERLYL